MLEWTLRSRSWGAIAAAGSLLLAGCAADGPVNPSFPMTLDDARAEIREMQAAPKAAVRPVVVISGYADPGVGADFVGQELRDVLGDETTIIRASCGLLGSMDEARDRVVSRVQEELPSLEEGWTAEVDVVGISMGGLVAQYAAMPREAGDTRRRLKIARLFTICSPLRGARAASVPTLEDRVVDMRPGSEFLAKVNASPRTYELYPYCRLGDRIVGEENAAPDGENPWWVATPPMRMAHLGSASDWRIMADIARRLRGEEGYTVGGAAGLPEAER